MESSIEKEREGSDHRVDERETWGELRLGRSEMEATTGWTDGKRWENSLLRAPLRRSEMEAKIRWTEGRKGNRGK